MFDKKAYSKKYRAEHKAEVAAYGKEYRKKNAAKLKAYKHEWYLAHKAQRKAGQDKLAVLKAHGYCTQEG